MAENQIIIGTGITKHIGKPIDSFQQSAFSRQLFEVRKLARAFRDILENRAVQKSDSKLPHFERFAYERSSYL